MRFLLPIFLFFSTILNAQTWTDITPQTGAFWYNTTPAIINLPDDYYTSSNTYPVIIFLPGTGETSNTRDDSLLTSQGLPYKISHGQVPQATVSGVTTKFIVICVQPSSGNTFGMFNHSSDVWPYFISWVKSNYRVDTRRITLTGLSLGAEGAHDGGVWNPSAAKGIAGAWLVAFTGNPSLNQPPDFDSTASMGKYYGVKLHAIYGTLDTAGITTTNAAGKSVNLVNKYNSTSPDTLAVCSRIVGGGHNSTTWNTAYDTSYRSNSVGKNIYEWAVANYSLPPSDPNANELSGVKIPITSRYVWQDNSQQDRADKLTDGDTLVNYSPARPIIYPTHEIVFDLYEWSARLMGVKVWIGNTDTCTVQVISVRKSNNAETLLGTFSGGTNQHFVYVSSDTTNEISKIILRSSSSNYQFGSEVEVWGRYTAPTTPTPKTRRPLGWMSGAVAHSYDLMNDAKLNKLKTLNLQNLRAWENGFDVTDSRDYFKFEPELGTDRYSTDSAFGILHRWKSDLYTWKVVTGQWTPQRNSWNVIDDFPNRYIKGQVTSYIDHGSWGEVYMNVLQVAQPTDYVITLWYVYKNGSQINVTETAETFSSSLVGQNRHYNVGGGLGLSVGDTLYFYKSQQSVNPIYLSALDLPKRDYDTSHTLGGKNMYVYASRGGVNASVPNYDTIGTTPAQRMLKGAGIYKAVEPYNEADAWWTSWLGFWNGKTMFHAMNMAYDGNKDSAASVGAKQADSTIDVIIGGLATQFTDQLYGMIDEARKTRGFNVDGTINLPFNAVNFHIYPSAGGQYGGNNSGGLPWESIRYYVREIVNLIERLAPNTKFYITEWGWDINSGSPLHAGTFAGYDRETVAAMWMARALMCMAMDGVDRSTYYPLFQDWPESSSNNDPTQFKTMRLLRQPVDANADSIVRSRQGDYMAQINEFRNYTYSDTVNTGQSWLHAYKFTNGDSTFIAVWSEEQTSVSSDTTQFVQRTGTINLNIPNGQYKIREFQDNGSATMSEASGTSSGNVVFSYAAKPIIITYVNNAPIRRNRGSIYF